MENKKVPLSINVIYWLTNIVFGLIVLVFLAALAFNILIYTGFFGNDMQLHVDFPVEVDYVETGNLHINDMDVAVELVQAKPRIHFFNTPSYISKRMGIMMLVALGFLVFLFRIFMIFIHNVRKGRIFNIMNIKLLKKFSYGLVLFWFFNIIYMRVFYYTIAKYVEFENIRVTNEFSNYPWILLIALLVWVLSHIFITGLKLQEEKDLTI